MQLGRGAAGAGAAGKPVSTGNCFQVDHLLGFFMLAFSGKGKIKEKNPKSLFSGRGFLHVPSSSACGIGVLWTHHLLHVAWHGINSTCERQIGPMKGKGKGGNTLEMGLLAQAEL